MADVLSCSAAWIFPVQGSNQCLLHWQADFLPLSHRGNTLSTCFYFFFFPHAFKNAFSKTCLIPFWNTAKYKIKECLYLLALAKANRSLYSCVNILHEFCLANEPKPAKKENMKWQSKFRFSLCPDTNGFCQIWSHELNSAKTFILVWGIKSAIWWMCFLYKFALPCYR